jgi:hypothetical protein
LRDGFKRVELPLREADRFGRFALACFEEAGFETASFETSRRLLELVARLVAGPSVALIRPHPFGL